MSESNNDINNLYLAIGYIVVKWAFIEQALDQCIASIFHRFDCSNIRNEIPNTLKGKTGFINQALNSFPELKSFHTEGMRILGCIANIKDRRHEFVHSALIKTTADDGVYHFALMRSAPGMHELYEWDFDVRSFPKLSERLEALALDTAKYANLLENEDKTSQKQSG